MGLYLLFKLRGARKAPPDVVVVATESASENQLNLPTNLTKWPRSLHARLIDKLAEKNAAVIAFDIFFRESRSPQDDHRFAKSIQKAGNIVLVEELEKKIVFDDSGKKIDHVEIEKLVPPLPLLSLLWQLRHFLYPKPLSGSTVIGPLKQAPAIHRPCRSWCFKSSRCKSTMNYLVS